jgi:signal transduction histidine kinase
VALGIKLRLSGMTVAEDPAQAEQIFGELQADATGALENLRDLARGIYPPLLADLGLAAALGAQASKSPLPVTVEADGIGRLPQDTEAAVYFCCLEALQNTAKADHAHLYASVDEHEWNTSHPDRRLRARQEKTSASHDA